MGQIALRLALIGPVPIGINMAMALARLGVEAHAFDRGACAAFQPRALSQAQLWLSKQLLVVVTGGVVLPAWSGGR